RSELDRLTAPFEGSCDAIAPVRAGHATLLFEHQMRLTIPSHSRNWFAEKLRRLPVGLFERRIGGRSREVPARAAQYQRHGIRLSSSENGIRAIRCEEQCFANENSGPHHVGSTGPYTSGVVSDFETDRRIPR